MPSGMPNTQATNTKSMRAVAHSLRPNKRPGLWQTKALLLPVHWAVRKYADAEGEVAARFLRLVFSAARDGVGRR